MAKEAVLQVRMEHALKDRAEELYRAHGTTLSEAVRLFVRESVERNAFPLPSRRAPSTVPDGLHAAGILAHRADPALRAQESNAWKKAAEAKHAERA